MSTDDVVAETFIHAWRDLPKLRKVDRFDSWLFRIAHNRAMDELRRRPTAELEEAAQIEDHNPRASPFEVVSARTEADLLRAALLELSDAQREVLILRYMHDLPRPEIVAQMGKTHEAVRALRQRALHSLRRILLPRVR